MARPNRGRDRARLLIAELAPGDDGLATHRAAVSAQAAMLLLGLLAFTNGSRSLPAYGMTAFLGGLGITAIATLASFGVLAMLQAAGSATGSSTCVAWRIARPRQLCSSPSRWGRLPGFRHSPVSSPECCSSPVPRTRITGWLAVVAIAATALTVMAAVRLFRDPLRGCR